MGHTLIIPGADFSSTGIPANNELNVYKSAEGVRALKVASSAAHNYGDLTSMLWYPSQQNVYAGYTYCVNVKRFVGRTIQITFCVGYGQTILANGGFVAALPDGSGFNSADGWAPTTQVQAPPDQILAVQVTYISTVGTITSSESNTWVTKTYTVPQGAKYLLFTSKYLEGGTAGAELVEEAES